jgi:hypothetical protein
MLDFNKKEGGGFPGGGGGRVEIAATKNPDEIILEKWGELASSNSLSENQKKMGEEWIGNLLKSGYETSYTDPQSEFFGYDERKALCVADRSSGDTRDLMDLLNATGEVDASIYTDAEIDQMIKKEKEARKKPHISPEFLRLREKEMDYLESLKNSVVLRSRKKCRTMFWINLRMI